MNRLIQKLQYRFRYYANRLKITLGICPICSNRLNNLGDERQHCPECARMFR